HGCWESPAPSTKIKVHTMARKEVIQYIDDLDGTPLNEDDVKVVRFGYQGRNYYLDLSADNAAKFDEALRPYVEKAHADDSAPATRTRRGTNPNSTKQRERNRIIRKWAKDRGMDVADRGALPKTIIDEYEATHS
ncbi:MAG: Lsr2 family protein, partial [Corynebacterium sp.]|nr:Lsr2 family protein [Corynebacterium sp.]